MAINFIKKEDLSHITRTTRQWETTIDRYEIIPKGVLCIELCNDKLTKIKIGNGHLIYEQLPYVSDVNLSDYYTKEETNTLLKHLKSIKIKGEASSLSDLPLRGNEEGDLWFISKSDPDEHSRYDEYVWYKNKWESFGSSDIDLSEYAKKSYVDTHIQEVQDEITEIIESGYLHKHNNKNILDQTSAVYNVEKDNKLSNLHNYDDTELREKAHTHLNKNILDQTDAAYNRDKDDKLSSLHNYDDTDIQDRISTLEGVAHSHDNQDILNRTTAAFTKEQALQLLDCKDFEGTDGVHDGHHGFVPAPTKDDIGKVLGANGQWVEGGGTGGDTITQGGGISITTDAQTGVKTVSVNAGTGLDIDQQTGELYVTSTGGDSIAEGGGIEITTDPQTGDKVISVDVGDNLEIDPQTGELNVTGVDYTAGKGIYIGTEYKNVEYIKNSGNYDQYILTDIVPNSSDRIEMDIRFGADTGKNTNKAIFGLGRNLNEVKQQFYVTLWHDSTHRVLTFYNKFGWIEGEQDNRIDPAAEMDPTGNNARQILTLSQFSASWGNQSCDYTSRIQSSYIEPNIPYAIFGRNIISEIQFFDSFELTVYGLKHYDSNNTLLHNFVPVKRSSDNAGGLYDTITQKFYGNSGGGSFVIGPETTTDERIINAKIGNGLQFDSNDAIEVNVGDGLSINQDNELEVNVGNGLFIDSTNNDVNVKIGRGLSINNDNEIDVNLASNDTFGIVKIGDGIDIDQYGIISVDKMAPFRPGIALELVDESGRLPAGYVRVEYVSNEQEGAWTQINYVPNANTRVVSRMSISSRSWSGSGAPYNTEYAMYGIYYPWDDANRNEYDFSFKPSYAQGSTTPILPIRVGFIFAHHTWDSAGETAGGRNTTLQPDQIFTVETSLADGLKIDNNVIHTVTQNVPLNKSIKIGIFTKTSGNSSSGGQTYTRGKIYTFKIYENDELKVNLIPCIQLTGNNVGFYDAINGIFYPSIAYNPFETDTSTIDVDPSDWVMNLLPATSTTIGGVKEGQGVTIDPDGTINVTGGSGDTVEAGDGIDIDTDSQTGNKVISVVTGNGLEINNDNEVELTPATQNSIGGIKVGDNLNISSDGTLSAEDETIYHPGDAISFINDAIQDLIVEHEEYYFDTQVTCELHGDFNRTFQKTTTDPALGVIWKCYYNNKLWGGPLFVGLTPNSVKYTTEGVTYNAKGSFEYLNATWYYGDTEYYVSNIQNQDFDGNMQLFTDPYPAVADEIQAAKDLIDAAGIVADGYTINVKYGDGLTLNQNNELEVNIGDGLTLDANEKITIDEDIVPLTHYFPGTAIAFDQRSSAEVDIWNNGNGWANGAYTSSTGNSYLAGYSPEYHSPIGNNSLEVPTNAIKIRVIALSTNDDVLSVTVHCLDASYNRYSTLYDDTQPYDNWLDLDASTRYVNFGVRWTLNSNVNISATDIKSVTLYWQHSGSGDLDVDFMNINVNYGDGLTVNQDNELVLNIDGGDGIDITTDSQTGNKVISVITQENGGLTIDEDTNGLKLSPSAAGKAINISDEITFDSWNNGTGWANEEYYDATSDQHIPWGQNLMIYPTSTDVLFRIPDGVTQAKCSATSVSPSISLKTGLYFYNAQGVHFAGPTRSTDPDTIIDIPAGSVYVNQSIRNVNDSNVFSSNVAGATITWLSGGTKIDVKYGTGLTLNQDNELEVNIGDGLSIDPDTGAINVTGGGSGDSIAEGDGITITTDSQTGVKTIGVNVGDGLDIDPLTNELFVNGQLPEGTILKKLTYVGNGSTSANNIQFSKKPLAIMSIYGSSGSNYIASNPAPIDAPYLIGDYGGVNTNNTCNCAMSYNDATNVLTLSPGYASSGDAGLLYNVNDRTYTVYYLTKGYTGLDTEGTIIKKLTYVGTGAASINIHFTKKPIAILNIYGDGLDGNQVSTTSAPIDSPTLNMTYGKGTSGAGVVSCNMSYNDTTNVLTLSGGVDEGARCNKSGSTYIMFYLVKGPTGSGTSENNEVSVVKTFTYVGTGTTTNNIQFPETPNMVLSIYGPLGTGGNEIRTLAIDTTYPSTNSEYFYEYWQNGGGQMRAGTYSFNNTTNILSLVGPDYGASLNYSGLTYTVRYIVNEVMASSNYDEGDGIVIDPDTGEISVNTGDGITVDANNKLTLDESVQLIFHCVGTPLT